MFNIVYASVLFAKYRLRLLLIAWQVLSINVMVLNVGYNLMYQYILSSLRLEHFYGTACFIPS